MQNEETGNDARFLDGPAAMADVVANRHFPGSASLPALWTPSQQRTLICLCFLLLVFLVIESWRQPRGMTDPPPVDSPRAGEIADRLDPNTADAAALSAIPNLGEKRAAEIAEFRTDFLRQNPGRVPFESPDDLLQIKGIGPATVASMEPFLSFPPKNSGERP